MRRCHARRTLPRVQFCVEDGVEDAGTQRWLSEASARRGSLAVHGARARRQRWSAPPPFYEEFRVGRGDESSVLGELGSIAY